MKTNNEKPITLDAEAVRMVLDGKKTQLRFVAPIKSFKWEDGVACVGFSKATKGTFTSMFSAVSTDDAARYVVENFAPYKVGQRRWVRETWQPIRERSEAQKEKIKAWFAKEDKSNFMNEVEEWAPTPDGDIKAMYAADYGDWAFDPDSDLRPWRSPVTMPRWASRITLEVVGVRAERVRDISRWDIDAEGCPFRCESDDGLPVDQMEWFRSKWIKKHGEESWHNDWVWVVEFKVLEGKDD